MSRKPAFATITTPLDGMEWDFDPLELGTIRLEVASTATLRAIDAAWPAQRSHHASSVDWVWYDACAYAEDRFSVHVGNEVVAMWSGKPRVMLGGVPCYRLDRIEVSPRHCGVGYGVAAFHLVVSRAREVRAETIVLASVPGAASFYRKLGALQGTLGGWHHPADLVPFYFDRATFEEIAADADEFRRQ